jgi:hypothetical protein
MATYAERFKRTYAVMEKEYDRVVNQPDGIHRYEELKTGKYQFNLMWLRNSANLWEDYVEDSEMIINGCQMDPNHPDNLSAYVWECFKVNH